MIRLHAYIPTGLLKGKTISSVEGNVSQIIGPTGDAYKITVRATRQYELEGVNKSDLVYYLPLYFWQYESVEIRVRMLEQDSNSLFWLVISRIHVCVEAQKLPVGQLQRMKQQYR